MQIGRAPGKIILAIPALGWLTKKARIRSENPGAADPPADSPKNKLKIGAQGPPALALLPGTK
jgi:hypothetical protein